QGVHVRRHNAISLELRYLLSSVYVSGRGARGRIRKRPFSARLARWARCACRDIPRTPARYLLRARGVSLSRQEHAVGRAPDAGRSAVEHVSVDHGGADVLVAE